MPKTHKIYHVPITSLGQLFIMPRPPSGELEATIARLHRHNVGKVVCLLPDMEITELGLLTERDHCASNGITFVHFPIVDFGLPEGRSFADLVSAVAGDLQHGTSVAVHCRAGIGRTGMLACCALKQLGLSAETAIAMVGKARGVRVPDTAEQRKFIEDFLPTHSPDDN